MMRLSQPNGAPQGISGGKDHQKHLDISVTAIRFNLLRITRIHTESELNMLLWPLITSQHNLTCVSSEVPIWDYTHMSPPPGAVLPQAQLMAGQHGWRGGQRQSAAMLLGQLQSQLHTDTQPCNSYPAIPCLDTDRSNAHISKRTHGCFGERDHQCSPEIHWDKVKNMTQHEGIQCDNQGKFPMGKNTSHLCLYVSFLMCWCLPTEALLAKPCNS